MRRRYPLLETPRTLIVDCFKLQVFFINIVFIEINAIVIHVYNSKGHVRWVTMVISIMTLSFEIRVMLRKEESINTQETSDHVNELMNARVIHLINKLYLDFSQ